MRDYLFIDQNINTLRAEIKQNKSALYKRLYDQCRTYSACQLPTKQPNASVTYMGIAAANLSLMYLLSGQQHFLSEAKRWIFNCVQYPHWGYGHDEDVDLSASWLLFGLSLSFDWLKEVLSDEDRTALREKLILQAMRMYDYKINNEGHGWSTNYWQNHNWINLTGLAAAGYAVVKDYPQAQTWIDEAKENFDYVFSALAEDGSDYEGVVYWRYGAMWLYVYAHLLKEREEINYFKSCKFLENSFYYRLYQAAPNLEEQINFGDCHDRCSGHSTAIYYKTAAEYGNGHAQKMGNLVRENFLYGEAIKSKVKPGILPECLFELLFFDASVPEEDFGNLPLVKYFEDLGLLVIRSSWEKDAIHFSFKCSYPGGKTQWKKLWELKNEKGYNCFGLSHQHPDNNSFILVANDTYLAIDDGYNRAVRAADHNVVLVDGCGYQDESQNNIWGNYSPDMVGEIEKFRQEEELVYIVGETAKTYQKKLVLNRFARHVLYTYKPYFIIFDELVSDCKHQYDWLLHSDVFSIAVDGGHYFQNGPGEMVVHPIFPKDVIASQTQHIVKAVMSQQEPENFCYTVMRTLSLKTKEKKQKAYFLNVIAVGRADTVKVTAIENQSTMGVAVRFEDEEDIFLYSPDGNIKFRGKEYQAKELYLNQRGDQIMKEVTL